MRKRRRLANKMTIMVCAVLLAVSAFFYAPMEVEASDFNTSLSGSYDLQSGYSTRVILNLGSFNFYNSLLSNYNISDDKYYDITFTSDIVFSSDIDVNFLNSFFTLGLNDSSFRINLYEYGHYTGKLFSTSHPFRLVLPGSTIKNENFPLYFRSVVLKFADSNVNISASLGLTLNSFLEISSSEADSYQNGYNAGYSAGETAGYGNGYSNGFADGEASVDIDAIYDEAFQAGKDSVDTDSYYDAGYQAGYQVAYSTGYDDGYDSGYDDAMSKVAQWGADTSEYPMLLTTKTMSKWGNPSEVQAGVVTDVSASLSVDSGIDVNHNHTYRFDISVTDYDVTGSSYIDPPVNHDLYFYVGSNEFYLISQNRTSCNQTLYVNGSTMSDVFGFIGKAYNVHVLDTQTTDQLVYTYLGYTVKIYDMGPTGDTQNHIANQTDKLNENADKNTDKILNSWDSSKGNKVQSDLDAGLNEYQTAEDSLWATATTGLKDFTFFDFESVPAMITGLSFVTSIMTRWFESAGGASGVGIVLSVLFSVMLVSMVLGLYRMYQSAGHRSEVKQRRESRKKG